MQVTAFTPFVYRCTFRGWYDGDSPTLDIDLGFRTIMHDQKIRLYGVNTPEVRGVERPRGLIVRDLVNLWAPLGTPGIIRTHKDKTGKFGRWLAEVYPEGWTESVNQRLMREGLAEIEAYTDAEYRRIEAMWA